MVSTSVGSESKVVLRDSVIRANFSVFIGVTYLVVAKDRTVTVLLEYGATNVDRVGVVFVVRVVLRSVQRTRYA